MGITVKSVMCKIRSTSLAVLNNVGAKFASAKTILHPNQGFDGATPVSTYNDDNIIGANTTTGGLFSKGIIRKVTLTIRVINAENFALVLSLGFLDTASYAVFTNDAQVDITSLADRTITLEKLGVFGDMKTIKITYDIPQREGNLDFQAMRANNAYWCSNAAQATNFQGYWISVHDIGNAINLVNGVTVNVSAEFEVDVIQQNNNLQI